MKKYAFYIAGLTALLLLFAGSRVQWDTTRDKRYTLSRTSRDITGRIQKPVEIYVYLQGDFPSHFRKLAEETRTLLDRFRSRNSLIRYYFVDPVEENLTRELTRKGMEPASITVRHNNRLQQMDIFPWAEVRSGDRTEIVPLMVRGRGESVETQINRSIENLEYALASAIHRVSTEHKPAIAVLKGHGEWDDLHIADLLMSLRPYYRLAPFTLDSLKSNPGKTLDQLKSFDMVLIAGPTRPFGDTAKYALDQFIMNGGRMFLAADPVHAYKDTLMKSGKTYALNAELNLTDWLFAYGLRMRPELVKDLVAAPVMLKTGEVAGNPQLEPFPWYYSPLALPDPEHPVTKNIGRVKLDFASPLDTLKTGPRKTVLLHSSPYTRVVGVPLQINFSEIGRPADKNLYRGGTQNYAVLVEGPLRSAYADRTKPFDTENRNEGNSRLIVVADGDVLRNDVAAGKPMPLGYDKWSRLSYDNKTFMMNAIAYLLDNQGLLNLKNKEYHIPLLDKNKVIADGRFWALLNTFGPVLLWILAGILWIRLRRKKYAF